MSPNRRLAIDVSRWPLALISHRGRPSDDELRTHLREIEAAILGRAEPFVQIVDQSGAERPDAFQRGLISEHQERMDAVYRQYCLGEAYVNAGAVRGAMKAVFWIAPPPYKFKLADTLEEALEWARARALEAGLSLPG
jgi:hypothetical protein